MRWAVKKRRPLRGLRDALGGLGPLEERKGLRGPENALRIDVGCLGGREKSMLMVFGPKMGGSHHPTILPIDSPWLECYLRAQ